jgi:hypothetical protein
MRPENPEDLSLDPAQLVPEGIFLLRDITKREKPDF